MLPRHELEGNPEEQVLYVPTMRGNLRVTETLSTKRFPRLYRLVEEQFRGFLRRYEETVRQRPLVDFGHHTVRIAVVKFFYFILATDAACSGKFQTHHTCPPFAAIIYKIRRKKIKSVRSQWKYLDILGSGNKKKKRSRDFVIPVLILKNFEHVHAHIVKDIQYIQQVLKTWDHKTTPIRATIDQLCPKQKILMWHIIQLNEDYGWVSTDIRVIFHVYSAKEHSELPKHYDQALMHLTLLWDKMEKMVQPKVHELLPGRSEYLVSSSDGGAKVPDFNLRQPFDLQIRHEPRSTCVWVIILPTLDESRLQCILNQMFNLILLSRHMHHVQCLFVCATTQEVFQLTLPDDPLTKEECVGAFVEMLRTEFVTSIANKVVQFMHHVPAPIKRFENSVHYERTANYVIRTMERL